MHMCATRWQHCYADGKGLLQNNCSLKKKKKNPSQGFGERQQYDLTAIIHSFVLAADSSILLITFWK